MSLPAPLCWLCLVSRVETRLDTDSKCSIHGLVKDRVLGFVRVDVGFFKVRDERLRK